MDFKIEKNINLKPYNSFGIDVIARELVEIPTEDVLLKVLKYCHKTQKKIFILNGGSNILFTREVEELVVLLQIKGKKIISEKEDSAIVEVQSSENWNEFVQFCLQQNLGGLENLSLIPGNSGTSPMQNIGAYGVEIKEVFHQLTAINIHTFEKKIFTKEECKFGYRESFFKNEGKGQYIIISVQFQLQKPPHTLHTTYGAIASLLSEKNIENPTIQDVSHAVVEIRKSKLPDPNILGNAGSFFKNPIVSQSVFLNLLNEFPEAPHYVIDAHWVKVPAGWLIEKAGWKGKRIGNCGVHDQQALVLVNYGNATGKEIYNLSSLIIADVEKQFKILLEREVNIY